LPKRCNAFQNRQKGPCNRWLALLCGVTVEFACFGCQIASNYDPCFACKGDPIDVAKTGVAEPYIAEQSRSWRTASGEREVMRGS
jgi:hypothetical protein